MRNNSLFQAAFLTATCLPMSAVIAGILWSEGHAVYAVAVIIGITAVLMALTLWASRGVNGYMVRRIVHDDIIFTPAYVKYGMLAVASSIAWFVRDNPYLMVAAASFAVQVLLAWRVEHEIVAAFRSVETPAPDAQTAPQGFRRNFRYATREALHFLGLLSLHKEMERLEEAFQEAAIMASPEERERAVQAIRDIQTALGLDILAMQGHANTLAAITAFETAIPNADYLAEMMKASIATNETPKENHE